MITINNVTVTVNQILVEVDKETFSKSVQGKLEQPVTQASEPQQVLAEAPAKRTRRTKEEIQAAEQPVTQAAEPTTPSRILPAEHVESPSRRSFEEEQPTRAFEPPARRSFSDETATAPEPPATGRRRSFSDDAKAPTESQQSTAPTRRSYAD